MVPCPANTPQNNFGIFFACTHKNTCIYIYTRPYINKYTNIHIRILHSPSHHETLAHRPSCRGSRLPQHQRRSTSPAGRPACREEGQIVARRLRLYSASLYIIYSPVFLASCISAYLSILLSICVSVHLSVFLSTYVYVYTYIHMQTCVLKDVYAFVSTHIGVHT